MKILSIDSSGKTAACSVTDGSTVLANAFSNSGLTHSQTLLPMIDNVLNTAGLKIDQIDAFALTVGPGSFTGLRIGAATVMGLAGNKPVYAVPTLLALAYNLQHENAIIIPALDARRKQVYTAVFEAKDSVITRIKEDCAVSVDEVYGWITEFRDKTVYILGDGAYLFDGVENISIPQDELLYPLGVSIAIAAREMESIAAKDINLSYLRLSQAERELKEKQKND